MGSRQIVRNATSIADEIRKIINNDWDKKDDDVLITLQRVAFYILSDIDNKADLSQTILNAANEVAVGAFLADRLGFLAMPDVIEHCMQTMPFIEKPLYEDYIQTHHETLAKAGEFLNKHIN